MKILVFTEGTLIMHFSGKNVSREKRIEQSKAAGIQGEERRIAYEEDGKPPETETGGVYDFARYVPIGNAASKIFIWRKQGAEMSYLTSRRYKVEIDTIGEILEKYNFPNYSNLHYRQQGEDYKDVAEKLVPDILIEDDCGSIGGENEMTYTFIKPRLKEKIKSIPVKEFGGIDHLPDNLEELKNFQ